MALDMFVGWIPPKIKDHLIPSGHLKAASRSAGWYWHILGSPLKEGCK